MNEKQRAALGEFIRTRREALGLPAREVARKIGVPHTRLGRMERGEVIQPSAELLGRVASALGVPASELMRRAGYPVATSLPELRPYMRAKFTELPPEAIDEVEQLIRRLRTEHPTAGPDTGEDEY